MKTGGIELGGTKTVYGYKDDHGNMERHSIPTTDPDTVLLTICDYFQEKEVERIGIARFGPIDLASTTITTTGFNIRPMILRRCCARASGQATCCAATSPST